MRTLYVNQIQVKLQYSLYSNLNDFSQTNKILGRFCSIPVSVLDIALDVLSIPLITIEYVAWAAINLIGVVFSKKFSLKDTLICTELALVSVLFIPVKLVLAPFKITFQFFAIIINPEKVMSINWMNPTFKEPLPALPSI